MSRILKNIFKNEAIVECPYCEKSVAYTKDDVQVEKTVEVTYFGAERWERDYIICPNCGKKITWNWH